MPEYDNHAIARVLETAADLLQIDGADKFRVLSYRRAAASVALWPEELASLAAADRLTEIPGVGAKLAANIIALMRDGTFPDLDALKARWPVTLVEVMRISGMGPKRARQLFESLGVDSIDALEREVVSGAVARLGGFGEKSAAGIAAGIEAFRRHSERLLLADALPLAERLVRDLERSPAVARAAYAGSLRRMSETIGDIDVVVASGDPAAVMELARTLPTVTRVLGSGETKTSVMTTAGMQADVRVVAPDEWGAALVYFTGSKDHNVRIRALAKEAGLKLNEYGVFRLEDGARVAGSTEEDVYAALGMDVPPPEIREDRGEVEAALERRLPALVTLGDVRGDLQTHSTYTDGHAALSDNKRVAAELGYEYLAATDHALKLAMVGGLTVEDLARQADEIDALNAEGGPRILKGIELNIDDDGEVDYPEDVLARFDICLASLHSGWGQPSETGTKRLLRAIANPFVDVIAHPTGRILGRRDPIAFDAEAVFAAAGENGTILEINAYPDRLDLSAEHIRLARTFGARFSLGTDSHDAASFHSMRYGVATGRRGWVTAGELLNAQPWEVARTWLKRSRA